MMAKFAEQLADSGKITDSVEISGYIKELCLGRPFLPFKNISLPIIFIVS